MCRMSFTFAFSSIILLSISQVDAFNVNYDFSQGTRLSKFTQYYRTKATDGAMNRSSRGMVLQAGGKRGSALPADKIIGQANYEGVDKDLAKRVVEQAERAIQSWSVEATDFLRPPEYTALEKIMEPLVDVQAKSLGGYEQAERKRMFFCRGKEDMEVDFEGEYQAEFMKAINIQGNFLFDPADHRDFLGSILGTGISREKVGDILVTGERGAQAVVCPEIADFLCMKLSKVRSTTVTCSQIPFEQLSVAPPRKKQVQSVEASLRIDAVVSAGMGMSRSKMADLIKSGNVLINWKDVSSSKKEVKEGDVVTIRGKGRVEILEISKTAKGRFRIMMNKIS
mmetsp:Transcript_12633/g.16432  ORF Transcript_12633/g.16432 Transcript_12633/m.16432 type:complete len:339 (+) Transcript_12633:56-1072(+)